MSQQPDPDSDRRFNGQIEGFGALAPPSLEDQELMLAGILERHHAERSEAGLTTVAVDLLPVEAVSGNRTLRLSLIEVVVGSPKDPQRTVELQAIWSEPRQANGDQVQFRRQFIPVCKRFSDGRIEQAKRFDGGQARTACKQIDELKGLKTEGVLPAYQPSTATLSDPSRAIALRPDSGRTRPGRDTGKGADDFGL